MCRVEDVRTGYAILVGGPTPSSLPDVDGNDGRHDGSVRGPDGVDVCGVESKATPRGAAVYPRGNVSAGLFGSVDNVQRRGRDCSMAAACDRLAFSDDGQHEPSVRRFALDRGRSISVESIKTGLPQPLS